MKKELVLSLLISSSMNADKIKIAGIDKVKLFRELFDYAKLLPLGYPDQGKELRDQEIGSLFQQYVGILNGRVMKIDISGDETDTELYNDANGRYAAEKIIEQLRKNK